MEELELLKSNWQKREHVLPKLTYNDIYALLLKKSSSIVKWIFLISIAEIIFWTALAFLVPESNKKINDGLGLHNFLMVMNILNYIIFGVFIVLFYSNYRKIKVTDTVRQLMKNILRARKTVKYFVIYNVSLSILLLVGVNLYYYMMQDRLYKLLSTYYPEYATIPQEKFTNIFFVTTLIFGVIFIGLIILFYRVVYGILLRRLKRNYDELEKIEM